MLNSLLNKRGRFVEEGNRIYKCSICGNEVIIVEDK
ncbi:hypothetical protein [Mesobacillus foraminis]